MHDITALDCGYVQAASRDVSLSEVDDDTFVVRAGEGDLAAFEELVRRYQRPIYALCLRMLDGSTDAAGDAVQQVFLTAWRRLPERPRDVEFRVWLHRIATRRCLTTSSRGPAEDQTVLARSLGVLPARHRACWLLRDVQGLSDVEIAYVLDLSQDAVRAGVVRARVRLAAEVAPQR